jgi:hypothetical protein
VIVNYWLASALTPRDTLHLEFLDATGKVIREFSGASARNAMQSAAIGRELADTTLARPVGTSPGKQISDTLSDKPRGTRPVLEAADDTLAFTASDSIVTARRGLNRFTWDLHYPDTREVPNVVNDEGSTRGPVVAPGTYTARLTVNGRAYSQPFVVRGDPRLNTTQAEYDAQLALALDVQRKTNELSDAVRRIVTIERAMDERVAAAKGQSYAKRVADQVKPIHAKLEAIRDSLVEIHSHTGQITLHFPIRYYNMLLSLAQMVQSADDGPTQQEGAIYRDIAPKVDNQIGQLRSIESNELAAFNALLRELNVPGVPTTPPAVVP